MYFFIPDTMFFCIYKTFKPLVIAEYFNILKRIILIQIIVHFYTQGCSQRLSKTIVL